MNLLLLQVNIQFSQQNPEISLIIGIIFLPSSSILLHLKSNSFLIINLIIDLQHTHPSIQLMSRTNGQLTDQNQSKFLNEEQDEDADILPDDLSGDENVERSILHQEVKKTTATKANFFLTVMTIMKTIIGAGVLSLPFTISKLGYVLAIIIFVLVMSLSYFSTTLLVKVKNLSKHSNFSTIFYFLHKNRLVKGLGSIFIVLKNVGICTAELTIFKESIRKMIKDFVTDEQILDQWYTSEIFIVFIIAACEFPLAAARKIERLKLFSFIGISGIAFFLICLLIHFFVEMEQIGWQVSPTMYPFPQDWLKFSAVIPNVLLSLTFQANFFPIYKGMKNSNDHRITSACLTAIVSCGSVYLIVSLYTYMLYGSDLQANFLLCIDKQKTQPFLYYGMNIGFLVSVLFAYPIMFFSARNNFIAIVKLFIAYFKESAEQRKAVLIAKKDDVDDDGIGSDEDYPAKQQSEITQEVQAQNALVMSLRKRNAIILYYGLTLLLYTIIVLLAILAGDIEFIFNIVGAICSTTICFILPYYFYSTITEKLGRRRGFIYYYTKIAVFILGPYAIFSIVVKNLK